MQVTKSQMNVVYAVVITAVVVFGLSYMYFKYMPEHAKVSELKEYKKALYSSVLCQYSCPLTPQNDSKNKTQMLPGLECVKKCTDDIRNLKIINSTFTEQDLKDDSFVADVSLAIDNCKKSTLNNVTLSIDNLQYFPCVSSGLEALKSKYSYLN